MHIKKIDQCCSRDDFLKSLENGTARGGSETFGAVAHLRKVNFLLFHEEDGEVDVHWVNGFDRTFKRTICLHYNGSHYRNNISSLQSTLSIVDSNEDTLKNAMLILNILDRRKAGGHVRREIDKQLNENNY